MRRFTVRLLVAVVGAGGNVVHDTPSWVALTVVNKTFHPVLNKYVNSTRNGCAHVHAKIAWRKKTCGDR
jgi:ribosomal protein S17